MSLVGTSFAEDCMSFNRGGSGLPPYQYKYFRYLLNRKRRDGVTVIARNEGSMSSRQCKIGSAGLTLVELLAVMAIGMVLTLIAVPIFNSAITSMRLNTVVNNLSTAIGKAR